MVFMFCPKASPVWLAGYPLSQRDRLAQSQELGLHFENSRLALRSRIGLSWRGRSIASDIGQVLGLQDGLHAHTMGLVVGERAG